VKKTARSASSHSSAGSQRDPCATANKASRAVSEASNLDIFSEESNTPTVRVQDPRILVIRPGALGDTILALPALQALRARYPRARLDLVGYPTPLQLVQHAVRVNAIHSIDRAIFSSLFSGPFPPRLEEFLRSYDLLIAWIGDRSGGLLRKLERSGRACLRADPYPLQGSGVHASLHLLRTLTPLGVGERLIPPRLLLPSDTHRAGRELLRRIGLGRAGFLAVHPGSGSPSKNWPTEKFAGLLELARRSGKQVAVLEGEADGEAIRMLRQSIGWWPPAIERPNLSMLAALMSRAGAFLGNDSGVSHLAAASGAPTLTLFGPTDPETWAPRGRCVRILPLTAPIETVWAELTRIDRENESRYPPPQSVKHYKT